MKTTASISDRARTLCDGNLTLTWAGALALAKRLKDKEFAPQSPRGIEPIGSEDAEGWEDFASCCEAAKKFGWFARFDCDREDEAWSWLRERTDVVAHERGVVIWANFAI